MASKRIYRWAAALGLAAIALLAAAWLLVGRPSPPGTSVTVGSDQAWVEAYLLRTMRSVLPDAGGVRFEAAEGTLWYRHGGDPEPCCGHLRQDASARLAPGDSIHNLQRHGGQSFTVRKLLADRVVIDYASSHAGMGGDSVDTGTVELAYRLPSGPR